MYVFTFVIGGGIGFPQPLMPVDGVGVGAGAGVGVGAGVGAGGGLGVGVAPGMAGIGTFRTPPVPGVLVGCVGSSSVIVWHPRRRRAEIEKPTESLFMPVLA
jgi:hypothetical protein